MTASAETVKNEDPTWDQVIQEGILRAMRNVNTCMPAELISFNKATGLCEVQPQFKKTYVLAGGATKEVDLPKIVNVPLAYPRANQAAITFPVKKGDQLILFFSQRSIDTWKQTGGVVNPNDPRHHDFADAFAYPGGYPVAKPTIYDDSALIVRYGAAKATFKENESVTLEALIGKITVDRTGKVSLGNGSVELLDLFDKTLAQVDALLTAICALTVPTGVGPSGVPINKAQFATVQTQVALLKTQLGLIKA